MVFKKFMSEMNDPQAQQKALNYLSVYDQSVANAQSVFKDICYYVDGEQTDVLKSLGDILDMKLSRGYKNVQKILMVGKSDDLKKREVLEML